MTSKLSKHLKRSKKPLPEVEIISFGEYTRWDREDKSLPKLIELTEQVKTEIGVEFGMIVEISHGKGRYLQYRIDHPPFKDENGSVMPPFEGEYQVRTNPYRFFLGDTIWAPVADKKGTWSLSVFFDDTLMAEKSIELV